MKFSDSEIFFEEVLDSEGNVDVVFDDKLQHVEDDHESFLKIPTCVIANKTESINNTCEDDDKNINNKHRDIFYTNSSSASTPRFSRVSAFHTYARNPEYVTCEKVM